jgi:hypothetical protein
MRTLLTTATLAALVMTAPATAQTNKLPAYLQGEWCYDAVAENYRRTKCESPDIWLSIKPSKLFAHEMHCALLSASSNRSGEYRVAARYRTNGEAYTIYYWIGRIDDRLFVHETDSTFTKNPPEELDR